MLSGHKGYASSCQYVPNKDADLITSSGDQTCVLWDMTTGQRVSVFSGESPSGHTADVLRYHWISRSMHRIYLFLVHLTQQLVCGIAAKVLELSVHIRPKGRCEHCKIFPDGQRFGTGSDDGACRLFDVRTGMSSRSTISNTMMVVYQQNSIGFSISGRLLFVGYSNGDCYVWGTSLAKVVLNLGSLQNSHNGRISCLGLSADGSALCTGCWDIDLKVRFPPDLTMVITR
ncbi:hypothetical protein C5167_042453 [Papaver somniferum]|uniref:Uncharacterized protein n=1 Tax=Papaver somniferum TaxID=3469 RepID=A0A4Y7L624_PAPSO|nr:hypothetical protein C5167_042453 [Papaver somniferum]